MRLQEKHLLQQCKCLEFPLPHIFTKAFRKVRQGLLEVSVSSTSLLRGDGDLRNILLGNWCLQSSLPSCECAVGLLMQMTLEFLNDK